MRVLLAEDDDLLGSGLRAGLRQQGFQVDWVRDGVAAERELRAVDYAAAVLDLGAPAERVAGYHSGLLLPREGIDEQLDALVAFARRLGVLS